VIEARERRGEDLERITKDITLTRGLGRSYGDASLPPADDHTVAATTLADRVLSFDPETGIVRTEAGLPLWRLNRLFLPHNWFTPVTPGTHSVTLGGMVAADVHGKNHHAAGCFGEHVRSLRMRVASGRIIECSEDTDADLFRATLGGMGLTGHILEAEFQMQRTSSPWIWQESERLNSFESVLERLQEAGKTWPYTVCWADFLGRGERLGRGVLQKGRWAEPAEVRAAGRAEFPRWRRTLEVPFPLPDWALQRWMAEVFNLLVFWQHGAKMKTGIVHPEAFFYPLDIIRRWNRLYGKRGFTQYQCVLPPPASHPRHRQLLEILRRKRADVFLCVVKDCGPEGKGMISFPKPGISYALDLPVSDQTQGVVDTLNEHVVAEGGRIYLAKDAFTRPQHYRAMEPRLDAWLAVRRKWDPKARLKSAQSVRVFGDAP
jgi:FAD/FMN-containing dehydrogenase